MRRTVLRDTRNSRAIALILLPFTWNSRRTRPIVSTVSIPASPSFATRTNEGILDQTRRGQNCKPITPPTGAKLHAGSQRMRKWRSALAARLFAVRPALGFIGVDGVADESELSFLWRAFVAPGELVRAMDKKRMHRVCLSRGEGGLGVAGFMGPRPTISERESVTERA